MTTLTTHQKGKGGEFLGQYGLIKHGIESAPMTTGRGIDLVELSADGRRIATIQVKPTLYGDGGAPRNEGVPWTVRKDCPADYVALVDLERNRFWLFPRNEFMSRGHSAGAGIRLGWNVNRKSRRTNSKNETDFTVFEMDKAIPMLLGNLTGRMAS